ncbi:Lys63-specific deubiquitinase [Aureococcus anophagefferens]|nr:Lys63-specific deubiquitinase [Aureococcus anophagefferens]
MADPPPRSPARHPELRRPSSGGSLNGAPPRGPPTPTSGGREDPRRNGERAPRRGSSARNPQRLPDATVVLNIYDVVEHPFAYSIGKWMTLGIHHTGIQVGMREFAFTLEGIVITEPHRIPRCKLTHRILLTRNATDAMVQGALTKLQREFTPATYDPLLKNCNHFSDAFCARIGTKHVPRWVNRAPTMASMLGTRFRLRPAKVTAPPVAWSVMIPDGEAAAKGLASNRCCAAGALVLGRDVVLTREVVGGAGREGLSPPYDYPKSPGVGVGGGAASPAKRGSWRPWKPGQDKGDSTSLQCGSTAAAAAPGALRRRRGATPTTRRRRRRSAAPRGADAPARGGADAARTAAAGGAVPSAWATALSDMAVAPDKNGSVKMNGLINGMYSSQKKKELVDASTIVAFDSGL